MAEKKTKKAPKKQAEKSAIALREEKILDFWNKKHIFKKTLEKPSPQGEFVFYDGPPFATGDAALWSFSLEYVKGCHTSIQDDAGLPCTTGLGLGLPWPSNRKSYRKRIRSQIQKGYRRIRHRKIQ
jgi:hypothetical protein